MLRNCIKYLILFFFSHLLNSCQKDNHIPIDPIIGNWKLAVVRQHDSLVNLDPCVLKSTIEIDIDNRLRINNYVLDTMNNCKAYTHVEKWFGSNGTYSIDTGSVFNQKHQMTIEEDTLIYFFEGWEFTDSLGIIVIPTERLYLKF